MMMMMMMMNLDENFITAAFREESPHFGTHPNVDFSTGSALAEICAFRELLYRKYLLITEADTLTSVDTE